MGLQVASSVAGIYVYQKKYIHDLIHMACLTGVKPIDIPLELNVNFHRDEGNPVEELTLYGLLVGSLVYLIAT